MRPGVAYNTKQDEVSNEAKVLEFGPIERKCQINSKDSF